MELLFGIIELILDLGIDEAFQRKRSVRYLLFSVLCLLLCIGLIVLYCVFAESSFLPLRIACIVVAILIAAFWVVATYRYQMSKKQ